MFLILQTFTRWVNHVLAPRGISIECITTGFMDGVSLCNLLEFLSGKKINTLVTDKPKNQLQRLENINHALTFMGLHGMYLVSINKLGVTPQGPSACPR